MAYTPVAQRNGQTKIAGAYVPVEQREELPLPAIETEPAKISMAQSTPALLSPDYKSPLTSLAEVGKDVGQSIARSAASAGVTVAKQINPQVESFKPEDINNLFGQELARNIFGSEPNKTIEDRVVDAEIKIKEWQRGLQDISKNTALSPTEKTVVDIMANLDAPKLAFTGVVGSVGLDLTPFGGLEKNVYKQLIKARTAGDAFIVLSKMGVAEDLARNFVDDAIKVANEKEAKSLLTRILQLQGATKTAESAKSYIPLAERFTPEKGALPKDLPKLPTKGTAVPVVDEFIAKGKAIEDLTPAEQDALHAQILEEVRSYSATPLDRLADDIASGKTKIKATKTLVSEKVDALGKGNYARIFTKDANASALDELVQTARDEGADITESDLLEAVSRRLDERKVLKEQAAAEKKLAMEARKKEIAAAKTVAEKEKIIRDIQNKVTESLLKKRYSIAQLDKAKVAAEARGVKAGIKAGYQDARESIVNQLRNTFEVKMSDVKRAGELKELKTKIISRDAERVRGEIVNYVKNTIPGAEQGKFLTMVKNAATQKDLIRAFARVDEKAGKINFDSAVARLRETAEKLSESPSVSADYRNKIKDIIGEYELKGHSDALIERLKSTKEFLEKSKAAGNDVDLPDRILSKLEILSRIPKDQLTLSQVRGLQNEIELLGQLGKTKWASKQALYEAEKELRKEALLEAVSPIKSHGLAKLPIGEKPAEYVDKFIKLRNVAQKTKIGITPIEGLADITGMQPMKEALDLSFGNYLVYNDVSGKKWIELTKDFSEKNYERIGAYAISKQKGGLERLAANGITQAEIDAIKLTPAEEAAYNFVRETFDAEFPKVKQYAMDVYNADVGQIDNYVSFMSDYDAMNDLEIYDRFGQRAFEAASKRTKTVEQGFTKERAAEAAYKLELNIDKIFRRHTDDVAYMLNMGRDVKQYFEIVNSPEMREKLGDVGSLAWLQYLDLMARKGGTEGAKRIAALDILRKNISAGVLGFRLSSALIQFTSFADTIGTLGAEYATRGASNIATSKEWRNFIMDNFPEIKKAVGDDIAFREFGDSFMGRLSQQGMKPLQVMDGIMRSTAASAAYEKLAFEKGIAVNLAKPDKQLIQKATKLVRQSQGSSFFKDQPLAITSGFGMFDNKSINKTILTFQSFMLNRWDNMERQIWRMGIKEKNYKKAAASFFWLVIFSAAMEEGLRRVTRSAMNFLTGDEQPEESFVQNAAFNVIQSVPLAGSIASSMMYSSNPVPVINTFDDLVSGSASAISGKAGTTKAKGAVQAAGAAGSLLGLPGSSQAAQIIRKVISGSANDSKGGDGKTGVNLPKLPKLPALPKLSK